MKHLLWIIVLSLCLPSCAWYERNIEGPRFNTDCRYTALVTALYCEEHKIPYRIWIGTVPAGRHAQTEAVVDGEWWWMTCVDGYVQPLWDHHNQMGVFEKERVITIREAVRKWFPTVE